MNEQDFNRLKEISKELNDIRLRSNLQELQLKAENDSFTHYEYHEEWNKVMLLTRGDHPYKDCKIVYLRINKKNNQIEEEMDYDKYINYK